VGAAGSESGKQRDPQKERIGRTKVRKRKVREAGTGRTKVQKAKVSGKERKGESLEGKASKSSERNAQQGVRKPSRR
jgi:hypothetical protein